MDNAKIDYILDIFKTLTTEMPEQMLYRENGDSFELKTLDDIGEVLDGASKDGVIRFKGLDPDKGFKLTMEAYSDNWEIELEDFVFEIE